MNTMQYLQDPDRKENKGRLSTKSLTKFSFNVYKKMRQFSVVAAAADRIPVFFNRMSVRTSGHANVQKLFCSMEF